MECFAVYADEIEGRIDPHFYKPEFIELFSIFQKKENKIKKLFELSKKIVDAPHERPEFSEVGVKCILIQQLKADGISEDDIKFISEDYHNKLKSTKLDKNDLLMVRIGVTTGTTSIVEDNYIGCNISGNITRIKLKNDINAKYILY
jgi:hypothetical protein